MLRFAMLSGLLAVVGATLAAQDPAGWIGSPPVRALDAWTRGEYPRTLGAARDGEGATWVVGSGLSLGRFDGRGWQRLETDAQWLDIATTGDGRLVVGGVHALGVLETGTGGPQVRSLLEELPADLRDFRVCHQVVTLGREVLFVCVTRVLHHDGTGFRGWPVRPQKGLPWAGVVDGRFGLWRPGEGLDVLDGGDWRRISDGGGWRDQQVRGLATEPDGAAGVVTTTGDLLRIGADGEARRVLRLRDRQPDLEVGEARCDAGGRWLIGTLGHGLLVLDAEHDRFGVVRAADGLPSDVIHRVDVLGSGEVWLGTGLGLAVADVDAAVRRIDRGRGLRGQPNQVHREGDSLWIGTSAGLFHIRLGSDSQMEVERIPGPRTCWSIVPFQDVLLCAGSSTLWAVGPDGAEEIGLIDASDVHLRRGGDEVVMVGRGGMWSVRRPAGDWRLARWPDFDRGVWDAAEAVDGSLWLASDRGVLRLETDAGVDTARVTATFETEVMPTLLDRPGRDPLVLAEGRVLAAFDRDAALRLQLTPIAELDHPEPDGEWHDIAEGIDGIHWLLTADALWRAAPGAVPVRVPDLGRHEFAFERLGVDPVDPGLLWIVADDQVRVCDTSRLAAPFEALRIGLAVRPRHADREPRLMAPADVVLDLDPFPVDAAGPAVVRWRIAGETDWRRAPAAGRWLAERLPAGRHRIDVEVVSPSFGRLAVAERRFEVVPPWWRSTPVLALWIAIALGLLALGYRGGLRALRRRNADLGRLVAERTAALAAQTDHAERSAAWARATFDESPVALFEIDASGIGEAAAIELLAIDDSGAWSDALAGLRLRAANRAALDLAATPDTDGCGRWLRGLLRDGAVAFAAAFAELRDGRQTVEFACRSVRSTGSTLHLRIGLTALGELPPRWERVLASAVDETAREARESERRQIEARIREAQRLQGIAALAGGLAHDFNNLMMAVRGNAEFIRARADLAGDDEVAAAIRSIDTAAAHAGDLCEQMLTFAGRGRWRADRVEPNRVLEEMVGVMRGRVPRAIDIEVDVGPAVPAIVGDRVQLGQVLMNLVGNAAEAIGDRPGAIVVRCCARALDRPLPVIGGDELAPGAYVEFEVEDDGHGIDAATCERIFEPFFTTRSEGRGLGLAAVLGIVRGHRGGLAVRSAADHGTVVRVLLPAAPAAIGAEPSPEGVTLGHALRVAICDDDEAVRIATRRMLDHDGHSVETFDGGEGLLARLAGAADDFDVLLVDWVMPGVRGAELLDRLRAAAPRTPILVVSGLRDLGVETIGGTDRVGFLGKPFSRSRLAETLMAFLGPRRDAGAAAGAR